jgi:hypothetical protein
VGLWQMNLIWWELLEGIHLCNMTELRVCSAYKLTLTELEYMFWHSSRVLFVIPNEKDRQRVQEACGEDAHIVFITTPGQVCPFSILRVHLMYPAFIL